LRSLLRLNGFRNPLAAVLVLVLAVPLACRSGANPSRPGGTRDPYLIEHEELDASPRANLYDAVWELRPRWFTRSSRADVGDVMVYHEDQFLGRADVLRRFQTGQVASVRYLTPTEAQVRFGRNNRNRPAIVVSLER
jgi:hypothetical protein